MGSLISRVRLIYHTFKSIADSYSVLLERISRDTGIPAPNPSRSYWCIPPSPLDARASTPLPNYADVVIIGSGIAGTAIARTLLDHQYKGSPLRVVMLEARDVCSGATGRNGGHISPNTYHDYLDLGAKYGESAAQAIVRFRLAHLPALLAVAEEEDVLLESQARMVEQLDVFLQDTVYQHAKNALTAYLIAFPEQREIYKTYEDKSALEELQLSSRATGCISQPGGALHPYRLITGILARLLTVYSSFQLFTHTPCTEVTLAADGRSYCVSTPKGTVSAAHVVHATNAWAAHLLPGMQRKIVPVRVHMTAQRPGRNLGHGVANSPPWAGTRSFVFYSSTSMSAFDYLTQQPPADGASDAKDSKNITADVIYPVPAGELMFGGGARLGGRSEAAILDNIGIADDSQSDFDVEAYLGGALERYFALGWGEEAAESTNGTAKANDTDSCWPAGRMKAAWSGIMGLSADEQPWVGRVPRFVSKRAEPKPQSKPSADSASVLLARPGEWISAGFTGEGMTHAWLAGVALAKMMLADPANDKSDSTPDAPPLPPQFVITEKRWKEADFEKNWAD